MANVALLLMQTRGVLDQFACKGVADCKTEADPSYGPYARRKLPAASCVVLTPYWVREGLW